MKLLIFLSTIVLSASTFAAEEKLELFCTTPGVSSTLFIRLTLKHDAGVALGHYVFQATSDDPIIPSAFHSNKNENNVYTLANNTGYSIVLNQAANSPWVALVSLLPSGVGITLTCQD